MEPTFKRPEGMHRELYALLYSDHKWAIDRRSTGHLVINCRSIIISLSETIHRWFRQTFKANKCKVTNRLRQNWVLREFGRGFGRDSILRYASDSCDHYIRHQTHPHITALCRRKLSYITGNAKSTKTKNIRSLDSILYAMCCPLWHCLKLFSPLDYWCSEL